MNLLDPCPQFMSGATMAMNQTLNRLDAFRPMHQDYLANRVTTPDYLKPSHGESSRDRDYHDYCSTLVKPLRNTWEPKIEIEKPLLPLYIPPKIIMPKPVAFDFMFESSILSKKKSESDDDGSIGSYLWRKRLGLI